MRSSDGKPARIGIWQRQQRLLPADKELEPEAKAPVANYPRREALTYALRKLTGKDGGDSKEKWEELLFLTKDDKEK